MEKKYKSIMRKKEVVLFAFIMLLAPLVLSAPNQLTYCCEKTTEGAFCQSITDINICETNYKLSQTSCESTNYCQLGTCFNIKSGVCSPNTPKALCEKNSGQFIEKDIREVPQCQKGCCVIGENAQFITQTQCLSIGTRLGTEVEFRSSVTNEMQCLSTVNEDERGACVNENSLGSRNCRIKTRRECGGGEGVILTDNTRAQENGTTFYAGYLCSAEVLATNCIKQTTTGCSSENNLDTLDVYWYDSCGNKENIASDLTKEDTKSHNGGKIETNVSNIAIVGQSGNCDYYVGTACAEKSKTDSVIKKVQHTCQSTSCKIGDTNYKNGECWCGVDEGNLNNPLQIDSNIIVTNDSIGNGLDLVGSEYTRYCCAYGNITSQVCGTNRKGICVETKQEIDWRNIAQTSTQKYNYSSALCIDNKYSDCLLQESEYNCKNTAKRMCKWLNVLDIGTLVETDSKLVVGGKTININEKDGVCVPMYSPGDSSDLNCNNIKIECDVEYDRSWFEAIRTWWNRDVIGNDIESLSEVNFNPIKNAECLDSNFIKAANKICVSKGDCGFFLNYKDTNSTGAAPGYQYTGSIEAEQDSITIHNALIQWVREIKNEN